MSNYGSDNRQRKIQAWEIIKKQNQENLMTFIEVARVKV